MNYPLFWRGRPQSFRIQSLAIWSKTGTRWTDGSTGSTIKRYTVAKQRSAWSIWLFQNCKKSWKATFLRWFIEVIFLKVMTDQVFDSIEESLKIKIGSYWRKIRSKRVKIGTVWIFPILELRVLDENSPISDFVLRQNLSDHIPGWFDQSKSLSGITLKMEWIHIHLERISDFRCQKDSLSLLVAAAEYGHGCKRSRFISDFKNIWMESVWKDLSCL